MLKNALIALLACSTSVLAVVAFRPGSTPEKSSGHATASVPATPVAEQAAATPEPAAAVSAPDPQLAALREENARLARTIEDLQSEVSILNARRTSAPSVAEGGRSMPQMSQRILSELLGKPETVAVAMEWIRADQARRFASLIALADLDPGSEAKLRDLLAERYASRLDVASVGLDSVTADQRRQMETDFRARLESLVGPDVAALFAKAEGKPVSFERMQRLEDRLRYEARPLSREQYLPLWNLMSSQVFWANAPTSEAEINSIMAKRIEGAATIARDAEKLLGADQLAVLRAMLQDDNAVARVQSFAMIKALRARQERAAAAASPSAPTP